MAMVFWKTTDTDERMRARLLRGSLGSICLKIGYTLVQFGVGLMLARMLGPEGLGIYALTMALVHLLVIGVQFGFPAFLIRAVAVNRVQNADAEIKGLILGSGQIVLALSFAALAIGGLWLASSGHVSVAISRPVLMAGFILLPFLALTATGSGAIRGLGHVIIGQLPEVAVRPVIFLAVLIILSVSGVVLTPERALFAHGLAALGGLVFVAKFLLRLLPDQVKHSFADIQRINLMRQSLPFLLLAGAQALNQQTDVLMLGLLTTQDQIGLYRVAIQVSAGVDIMLFALATAIGPELARLHALGDWHRIQRVLVYGHRSGALLVLPLALVVSLFSGPFLAFVFGEIYHSASGALSILALGKIAYALVGFSGLALSMLGRPLAATIIALNTVGLNVVLNLVLIPLYGLEGAAIATVSSQFFIAFLGILYLWFLLDYNFSAFGRNRKL